MGDFNVEAPLAEIEDDDDFGDFAEICSADPTQGVSMLENNNLRLSDGTNLNGGNNNIGNGNRHESLEDLVATFDEKISKCFNNFQENVEKIAPVQIKSQEELVSESRTWWTITGNFGNAPPIDWTKSYSRRAHLPALNLLQSQPAAAGVSAVDNDDDQRVGIDEELALASDLDLHALIARGPSLALSSSLSPSAAGAAATSQSDDLCQSADEVIREINDMMTESDADSCADLDSPDSAICEIRHRPPLASREKLERMSFAELTDTLYELELIVQEYSEVLIDELARRDELEYEKELKNQFISMLLSVQSQRRQHGSAVKKRGVANTPGPKYLTTVIPFCASDKCPPNSVLHMLIKLLRAIDEDSPTVPTLLTDYILKVLCPS